MELGLRTGESVLQIKRVNTISTTLSPPAWIFPPFWVPEGGREL